MQISMLRGDWCEVCGNIDRSRIEILQDGRVICHCCLFTKYHCEKCGIECGRTLSHYISSICIDCCIREKWEEADEEARQRILLLFSIEELDSHFTGFYGAEEVAELLDIEFNIAVTMLRRMHHSLKTTGQINV